MLNVEWKMNKGILKIWVIIVFIGLAFPVLGY